MGLRGHECQPREEACFPVDPLELGMGGIVVPTLLLLRLGRSLWFCFLLLLGVSGPRRNHSDETRIGNRLPEMFGSVTDDKQEHAALGVLSAKPVQALVEVGVGHSRDRLAGMRERVLERGDNLGLVGGGFLQPFHIDAGRRWCTNELIDVVVGSRYMQKYFSEGTHIGCRTPGVFVGGYSLR